MLHPDIDLNFWICAKTTRTMASDMWKNPANSSLAKTKSNDKKQSSFPHIPKRLHLSEATLSQNKRLSDNITVESKSQTQGQIQIFVGYKHKSPTYPITSSFSV